MGIKERRHLYLYTVVVKPFPPKGLVPAVFVEAYNIEQAAHKLSKSLDEVIYITKAIVQ